MIRTANLSEDGSYRYSLTRLWNNSDHENIVVFVMLNPSTADALVDDPTIRRCIGFGQSWGYSGIGVVNLFAYRATNPDDLAKAADPIGPLNNDVIRRFASNHDVICAWGAHTVNAHRSRSAQVLDILDREAKSVCHLGLTKAGQPKHPLYLAKDTAMTHWYRYAA